jgi:hypothetical protein
MTYEQSCGAPAADAWIWADSSLTRPHMTVASRDALRVRRLLKGVGREA